MLQFLLHLEFGRTEASFHAFWVERVDFSKLIASCLMSFTSSISFGFPSIISFLHDVPFLLLLSLVDIFFSVIAVLAYTPFAASSCRHNFCIIAFISSFISAVRPLVLPYINIEHLECSFGNRLFSAANLVMFQSL